MKPINASGAFLGLLFSASLLTGCKNHLEGWGGFYYPSGEAKDGYEVEEFDSKEECEAWGNEKVAQANHPQAHYMCGYNCTYSDEGQGCESL